MRVQSEATAPLEAEVGATGHAQGLPDEPFDLTECKAGVCMPKSDHIYIAPSQQLVQRRTRRAQNVIE